MPVAVEHFLSKLDTIRDIDNTGKTVLNRVKHII